MGHHHSHHHHHSHDHQTKNKNALFISFIIITTYLIIVTTGGLLTNSLALLSDAGHMLSDAFSLGIGLLAILLSQKAYSNNMTYGYRRIEVLAALINGLILIGISLIIIWEALQRFSEPQETSSLGMLSIAIVGTIVNIIVAFIILKTDTKENINMRAALFHVVGDILGSIGVIIASLLILFFDWTIADPLASFLISIIILRSGFEISSIAIHILMEGIPMTISIEDIQKKLLQIPGIIRIHDIHLWSITSDFPALTCHLVIANKDHDRVLQEALDMLNHDFKLEHVTIQIQTVHSPVDHRHQHHCNTYPTDFLHGSLNGNNQ